MPRPTKDLTGKQFGTWIAIKQDGRIGTNVAWLCRCKNGHEKRIASHRLVGGNATQCKECRSDRPDAIYARDAKFIHVWQQAAKVADVAGQLDISVQQARSIASRLRQNKVVLKRMPRGRNPKAKRHYAKMRELAEEANEG